MKTIKQATTDEVRLYGVGHVVPETAEVIGNVLVWITGHLPNATTSRSFCLPNRKRLNKEVMRWR